MNMILLDNLFLSWLSSRPAAKKMCSDGNDVAGTARKRMAMNEILEYFVSFFFSPTLKS